MQQGKDATLPGILFGHWPSLFLLVISSFHSFVGVDLSFHSFHAFETLIRVMSRSMRWSHMTSKQRALVSNLLLGSSTIFAYSVFLRHNSALCLDSEQPPKDWLFRRTSIVSHNRPLSDRAQDSAESGGRPRKSSGTAQKDHRIETTASGPRSQVAFDTKECSYVDSLAAWHTATARVSAVCGSLADFDISSLGDKLTDMLVPAWVRTLPSWITKLQNELSMAPWSLSWEIWEEAHDPEINPEIIWDAQVRISPDLCVEEQTFLHRRLPQTAKALARYLDVPESEVHPDDVPIIAMCGSGGGLRALVAGGSSFLSTQEAGLFDCVTYTAGVSGSCWLQTLFNSSIGKQNYANIIAHLKDRIGIHIASPPALLAQLSQAPTNKFLLSGFVEKLRGVPDADFGLVDVYGLALAARLMVPRGELRIDNYDMKVSNQRRFIDQGQGPLPIYTAVRHELPEPPVDLDEAPRFGVKKRDSFQWFEWTPFEFYCEELEAGIPSWAVGREWDGGATVWRDNGLALPELRVPLYLGIWGSAFCATLSHYYKEIRPIILASGMSGLDALLTGKDEDLVKVHPIDPAVIPNFARGLRDRLPATAPAGIHTATHLQLMDAGMNNNLPIYPLLRPSRHVDLIIAFDASADVRGDNWVAAVRGYAQTRGIPGWPMHAGWPSSSSAEDLSHCTVWAGSRSPTPPSSTSSSAIPPQQLTPTSPPAAIAALLGAPDAGTTLVYFPLLANPAAAPGLDPARDAFASTWNFVYTPAEIERVVGLARANFGVGAGLTRAAVRAVWERKRAARRERERLGGGVVAGGSVCGLRGGQGGGKPYALCPRAVEEEGRPDVGRET
nr:cytosolic phospholipase a2 zeta [Quercus suber]